MIRLAKYDNCIHFYETKELLNDLLPGARKMSQGNMTFWLLIKITIDTNMVSHSNCKCPATLRQYDVSTAIIIFETWYVIS